jgi:ubiquinone biosynthesis protein Coq4
MSLDDAGPTPVRPLMALRALLALSQNPQDTTQVFRLGEAIKGRSPFKLLARFRSDPLGRQVLQERRPLLDTLVRTDWLQSLPPGSMGRVYHDFLAEQGLSAWSTCPVRAACSWPTMAQTAISSANACATSTTSCTS